MDLLALNQKRQKATDMEQNPFESKKINPFDSAKNVTINPFENAAKPPLNPFEGIASPHVPKSINPFDSIGNTSINPFEISQNKVPSNPFDQLSHQSSENTVSQLNKKLTDFIITPVTFTDTPLPQALLKLTRTSDEENRKQKSVSILCKLNGDYQLPKVSLKLEAISLNQAIKKVTESVSWVYEVKGDMVVVSPMEENLFEQSIPKEKETSLNPFDEIQ